MFDSFDFTQHIIVHLWEDLYLFNDTFSTFTLSRIYSNMKIYQKLTDRINVKLTTERWYLHQ